MALHAIDEAGNLEWRCPHQPEHLDNPCGAVNTAHISHEHIKWHGLPGTRPERQTVSLPPCSGCGAQTFLKVHFTPKELRAPNMWQGWNSWHEEQLQRLQSEHKQAEGGSPHHAVLSDQIQQLQSAKEAGGYHLPSHAVAQRHIELARQLIASGKAPEQGDAHG